MQETIPSIRELAEQLSPIGIKSIDLPVSTGVPNKDIVSEGTEVRAGLRDSPWRVQVSEGRRKSLHEVAGGVEDVDESQADESS